MDQAMRQRIVAQNRLAQALAHLDGCWARVHEATRTLQALARTPGAAPGSRTVDSDSIKET
jgi:hypothetical protein